MKLNIFLLGHKIKFFITRYFPRTIKIFETIRIKKILKANNKTRKFFILLIFNNFAIFIERRIDNIPKKVDKYLALSGL